MPTAISVTGLSHAFPDGRKALDALTFSMEENDCVGLVGANGAGKTTLLLRLAGVLKGTPGQALVAGLDPALPASRSALAHTVGVVFQHPDDQLFCPTVKDDIAFGLRNMDTTESNISKIVTKSLQQVGLAGFEDRTPGSLSGGQKRRAAIATVLAMNPKVWLFDEPTADLDPRARSEIKGPIQGVPGTKIIASHDLDFILDVCSNVIVLDTGTLIRFGPTRDLLADEPLMMQHGLEVPWRLRKSMKM